MQPSNPSKDPKFREAVTLLARLQRSSLSALDLIARDAGLTIKNSHETYNAYIGRLWVGLTGRTDLDLAYSTLALLEIMRDPAATPTSERGMRDRITQHVKKNLDDIKTEDARSEADFINMLRKV